MPHIIGRSSYQRIDNQLQANADPAQGADAREQARETLHKMATSMVGASGQVKRGYLKITTAKEGALRLGTRWSTSADASTRAAVDFIKSLVEQGFRDHPGVNREAVEKALASYTAKKGDRLGTHSFVKLVRDLESAAGISAKQDDRLLQARVKENAQLDSGDFELAPPSQPSPQMALPQAQAQAKQVVQAPQPVKPQSQPSPQMAQPQAKAQAQQVGQAPKPVAAARTEADLRAEAQVHTQHALTELRRGNYRAAAASLRAVQPPLSASDLARIVVEDHPERRPATTRLVLFAREAFSGREASAEEKAEFAFAAVTLPLGDDLKQSGLDPRRLSGLKDFATLMLALQPSESKAVAQALANRVAQELPTLESGEGFCAELRRIDPEQTIVLELDGDDIEVEVPETPEGMNDYLDRLQTDHPETFLADRAKKLQEKIRQAANPEAPARQRRFNPRAEFEKLAEEAALFVGHIAKMASQAREHKAVQIDIPESSYRSKFSNVAAQTADLYGARIEGSSFDRTAVRKAALSSFTSITSEEMEGAQLVGCVFNGVLNQVSFQGADLSGSDFTVTVQPYHNVMMQGVDFAGAKLDDASIRIDYDGLREELDRKRSPGDRQAALVKTMNTFDRTPSGSPLTTIASIDDRYAALKVGLMRDALRFIVQENGLVALARPLEDVLVRSPLFLADPEIRRLVAPLVPGLLRVIALGHNELLVPIVLAVMQPTAGESPQEAQQRLREELSLVSTCLHAVERDPSKYSTADQEAVAALRARMVQLPELKPIATLLDGLYLEYTRPDGQTVDMPYYFELDRTGSIAAMTADQFAKVTGQGPTPDLIGGSFFFLPPDQRYGEQGDHYYPVEGSNHVQLVTNKIGDRGPGLLQGFPLLSSAFQAGRPSPTALLTQKIFTGNETTDGWFNVALRGVQIRLNEQQIVDLETQFSRIVPGLFKDPDKAVRIADWPQIEISDSFATMLREQAVLAGVDPNDPRAMAHFMFAQSAVFARLSSEKVFGDGSNSIPALRVIGFALFAQARKDYPDLLAPDSWNDMKDRFLGQNKAFDCAEILSRMQLKASKSIDPAEFDRFVPGIFRSAGE